MQHISLKIDHLGVDVPKDEKWTLHDRLKMQRLYYIISGSGYYKDADGEWTKMVPGKIYVFPYNFFAQFKTERNNMVRHLFFDFISNPPIVGTSPQIYDVERDSELYCLVKYIEKLMATYDIRRMTREKIPHITSACDKTFDEERQVMYYALYQLMMTLHHVRPLPFLADRVVSEAIKYIRENVSGDLTIDILAQNAGFQSNYFIRYFKKIMNESPHTYIKSYRLICAQELLSSGLNYEQTAPRVGYKNGKSLWQAMRKFNSDKTAGMIISD